MQRGEILKEERHKHLEKMRQLGVDPFPAEVERDQTIAEALTRLGQSAAVAGRVLAIRSHGKALFLDLVDESGKIQIYARADELGDRFTELELLDEGDFLAVQGEVFTTKLGQISVHTQNFQVLAKALRPLPSQWYGLKDVEERYRQRYYDTILNADVRRTFELRTKIMTAIRHFLESQGFLEVDTPVLQPLYGGGAARPFTSELHDLHMKVYLAVSKELYLKRLIVGGFEKVYEMNRVFRNESIDSTHNPEFTILETMWAYVDYHANMAFFEEMIESVAQTVLGTTTIEYQGITIELRRPWRRVTMQEAIKEQTGLDVMAMTDTELQTVLKDHHLKLKTDFRRGIAIEEIFSELVQPQLIQPTFVTDYPLDTSPLAKTKRDDPTLTERFEPIINGWEMGNNYTELNDPQALQQVFLEQAEFKKRGDEEAAPYDEDFVDALEAGMPPTSGLGLGVDRLVMLLTNSVSIKDVIFFPFMKPRPQRAISDQKKE